MDEHTQSSTESEDLVTVKDLISKLCPSQIHNQVYKDPNNPIENLLGIPIVRPWSEARYYSWSDGMDLELGALAISLKMQVFTNLCAFKATLKSGF